MATPRQPTTSTPPWQGRFALLLGLTLGLAIWKFGNPVILDSQFTPPENVADAWSQPWPPRWAIWTLLPTALFCVWLAASGRCRWQSAAALWMLPAGWLAWELVAAGRTVDDTLTTLALTQFAGCLICFFAGVWGVVGEKGLQLLLAGILAAFAFCLVRAANQRLFEYPQDRLALLEGERTGWTNFAPEALAQMRRDRFLILTNGVERVDPVIMKKYEKGRVSGTLIYPNGLAGAVLLLFPAAFSLAWHNTRRLRPPIRAAVIGLTLFLGCGALFWSGSKSGWLIALGVAGLAGLRLDWPARWKWAALALAVAAGLGVFGWRFHRYFAAGATSVGARFDYWRAAVANTREHPWVGSGPGTFQRPYSRLKRPESEMARLAHNDYLEQFTDSGVPGGLLYLAWIAGLLAALAKRVWRGTDPLRLALFLGVAAWFAQGVSEFSLYIPALAWTAFALAGSLLHQPTDLAPVPSPPTG